MKKVIFLFVFFPLLMRAQTVTVNWASPQQTIRGFGGTTANIVLDTGMPSNRADFFFRQDTGIGLSLLRLQIIPTTAECANWFTTGNGWGYNGTCVTSSGATLLKGELATAQLARDRGVTQFTATQWSPSGTYKSNGSYNSGGTLLGTSGNYTAIATELASYPGLLASNGISLGSIGFQNEPDLSTGYPSAFWTAQQVHDFIPYFYTALGTAGYQNVGILMPEQSGWDWTLAGVAMNDATVAAKVSILGDHRYSGTYGPTGLANAAGKEIWQTEISSSEAYDGSITNALTWAADIHNALTLANANAWLWWWLSDEQYQGWGTDNSALTDNQGNYAKRAYAIGNFSKFIRPGWHRVGISYSGSLKITAFASADNTLGAIVVVNSGSQVSNQSFSVGTAMGTAVTPWITDATRSLASQTSVAVSGNSFTYTIPANSIVTFQGQANTPWGGILDPGRAVDWSQAGAIIPTSRTSVCQTIQPYGTSGSPQSASTINTAITNCATAHPSDSGGIVQLASGTFYLSSEICMKSNVTLRGAGADSTKVVGRGRVGTCGLYGGSVVFSGDNSYTVQNPPNQTTWTAGYTKGSTVVTLGASTNWANLHVGSLLTLDQLDDSDTPTNGIWNCKTVNLCSFDGAFQWSRLNRNQIEVIRVKNIYPSNGLGQYQVELEHGLRMPNWNHAGTCYGGQPCAPGAFFSSSLPIHDAGMEDFTVDTGNNGDAYIAVEYSNSYNTWATGMRIIDGNKTTPKRCLECLEHNTVRHTSRNNYYFGARGAVQAAGTYGWEMHLADDNLLENTIWDADTSPMIQGASTVGNVYAYNYTISGWYVANNGTWPTDCYPNGGAGLNCSWMEAAGHSHGMVNNFALFEGNDSNGFNADTLRGPSFFETSFRNWWHGYDPLGGAETIGGKTQQTIPFMVGAFNRYFNAVGNVLGDLDKAGGAHAYYECNTNGTAQDMCGGYPSQAGVNTTVYVLGFSGNQIYRSPILGDSQSKATLYRWGNYDSKTAATRWCGNSGDTGWIAICGQASEVPTADSYFPQPVPLTETLPTSFYLTSKPIWYGANAWPSIGPDVSGTLGPGTKVKRIPARICYEDSMTADTFYTSIDPLQTVRHFNPNVCYFGATSPAVQLLPNPRSFAGTLVGQSSTANITLTNIGTSGLTMSAPTFSGTNAADFALDASSTCGASLPVGQPCDYVIRFTPGNIGARSGSFDLTTNAPSSPDHVVLNGVGTTPIATLNPTAVDFGQQAVGSLSTGHDIQLTNTGTGPLSILSIQLANVNPGDTKDDFNITANTCSTSLDPGVFCVVTVNFRPSTTGPRTASLEFRDSASGSPHRAALSGIGTSSQGKGMRISGTYTLSGVGTIQLVALTLTSIDVQPSTASLIVGATQQYQATGHYSDNSTQNLNTLCTWSSSDATVATISLTGLARALKGGTTSISCTYLTVTSNLATLTVSQLTSVTVAPSTLSVLPTQTQQFSATGHYNTGGTQDLTALATWSSSDTNVATITSSGFMTAVAAGTSTISATYNSLTGTASVTVLSPSQTYYAQLPQVWVNSHAADGPYDVTKTLCASGCDYPATMAGLNLSSTDWANDTVAGQKVDRSWHVVVTAGTQINGLKTGSGSKFWQWPVKVINNQKPQKYLVYESSTPNPDERGVCTHVTTTPLATDRNPGCTNDWAKMWHVLGRVPNPTGVNGAVINMAPADLTTGLGVSHIVVKDMELTDCAGGHPVDTTNCATNTNKYSLIGLTQAPTTDVNWIASDIGQPSELGFERSYIHSDYDDTGYSANGSHVNTGIRNGCKDCWFMWNYFDQIGNPNDESHVLSNTDAGPAVKWVGNFIESASIPWFAGGGPGDVPDHQPSEMEIRRNYFGHNPAWMNIACGSDVNHNMAIKSNFEFKVGIRTLIDGNEFAYSNGCGQDGQSFTINVRASSGGKYDNNYKANTSHLTFSNNVSHTAGNGMQGSGRSGGSAAGLTTSLPGRYWTVINNLIYDTGPDSVPAANTPGYIAKTSSAGTTWTCPNVTRDAAGKVTLVCDDRVDNEGMHETEICSPDQPGCPAVGDPVSVSACTNTTFCTGGSCTAESQALGPAALAGTRGFGWVWTNFKNNAGTCAAADCRTVVYQTSTTGSPTSSTTETCVLNNNMGWPQYYTFAHNTIIAQGTTMQEPTTNPGGSGAPDDFMMNYRLQDNLLAINGSWYGWRGGGGSEGSGTIALWDTSTLKDDHTVFAGRGSVKAQYEEWDGAGTKINGDNPLTTLWFPTAVACSGATYPTPRSSHLDDCIGFQGMMSGSWKLNSTNPFADYVLRSDSPYKAGNERQASDGTDMGANLSAIQAARSSTKYSGCVNTQGDPHYCGPTGPYTD